MRQNSINTIQALRALAAVLVVLCHIPFIGIGAFGVDIFFVISGYIMAYVVNRGEDHFFMRRIFRIVPLYWLATFAIFSASVALPAIAKTADANPIHLLKSLLFVPYVRPNGLIQPVLFLGWTLNYEMFFYLVLAICIAINRRLALALCAAAILIGVVAELLFNSGPPLSGWLGVPALEFVAGIFVFTTISRQTLRTVPRHLAWVSILASIAAMISYSFYDAPETHVAICGPLAVLIFVSALSLEGRVPLPNSVLIIGDASYSLYLLHPYILSTVEKIAPMKDLSIKSIAAAGMAILLSLTAAVLSYRLIERRALRYLTSQVIGRGNPNQSASAEV